MFDSCFQQLSLHTDCILNAAIWSGQTRSILFFPAGSLPPHLLICVTPHKFSLKWDHMPFLFPFLLLILAPDLFFLSHLNLHLNFFFLKLSSQFSQSGFPPLHRCSDSPQPAAFVHRYATHGQMTLLTKCVCAFV